MVGGELELDESDVREERPDEAEMELKEEVTLEKDDSERGGEGDGDGGGEMVSERLSLGIEPNNACCWGVR
jgi:hypothetical protein